MQIIYEPIGTIHTPFSEKEGMPIQPAGASGVKGYIEMKNEYLDGLADLCGFSHIFIIYHFHRSKSFSLRVIPFMDNQAHGVFATRAPQRPNQIGISVVKLIHIHENILEIENADVLDGTPLLDIKPYVPVFDLFITDKCGWMDKSTQQPEKIRSDNRFSSFPE